MTFEGAAGKPEEAERTLEEIVGNPNEAEETFKEIVGKPDRVKEMYLVEVRKLVVLFSDATGMVNEVDEEMFEDTDRDPHDIDGADETLALALGNSDGVELWSRDRSEPLGRLKGGIVGVELLAEVVGSPEGDAGAIAVLFEENVGSLEGDPPDKVLLNEVVGNIRELEVDNVAEELLLADTAGSTDGAEPLGNPIDEMFNEIVGNPEEAVKL